MAGLATTPGVDESSSPNAGVNLSLKAAKRSENESDQSHSTINFEHGEHYQVVAV